MLEVAQQAVEAAQRAGAGYADARFGSDETESLTVKNQEMEGVDRSLSQGLGIRVLVDGYWGFAATARADEAEIARTAALAVAIARAASRLPDGPGPPGRGRAGPRPVGDVVRRTRSRFRWKRRSPFSWRRAAACRR